MSALTPQIYLQYMSAVWVHDDEQKQAAKQMVQDLEQRYGRKLTTKIQPAQHWTAAEEYHQKVCTLMQHLLPVITPVSSRKFPSATSMWQRVGEGAHDKPGRLMLIQTWSTRLIGPALST